MFLDSDFRWNYKHEKQFDIFRDKYESVIYFFFKFISLYIFAVLETSNTVSLRAKREILYKRPL